MIDKIIYPKEDETREQEYWEEMIESFRENGLRVSNGGSVSKNHSMWTNQAQISKIAIGNYWLEIFDNANVKLLKKIAVKSRFKFTLSIDECVKEVQDE